MRLWDHYEKNDPKLRDRTHPITKYPHWFGVVRVAYRGERLVLMRGGKAVAELSPVPAGTKLRDLPAILESLPRLSPEEATAFGEDLDRARSELGAAPPGDPWES